MRIALLCTTLADGREYLTEKDAPSVYLVPMSSPHRARGRRFDAIIETETARTHPKYESVREMLAPCLLG